MSSLQGSNGCTSEATARMIFSITDPVSMPVNLLDNVNVKEALHYQ
jgi:hypothetical protein